MNLSTKHAGSRYIVDLGKYVTTLIQSLRLRQRLPDKQQGTRTICKMQ